MLPKAKKNRLRPKQWWTIYWGSNSCCRLTLTKWWSSNNRQSNKIRRLQKIWAWHTIWIRSRRWQLRILLGQNNSHCCSNSSKMPQPHSNSNSRGILSHFSIPHQHSKKKTIRHTQLIMTVDNSKIISSVLTKTELQIRVAQSKWIRTSIWMYFLTMMSEWGGMNKIFDQI